MSVTSGFYNSYNGDRKYDAVQMSRVFEGILLDGILASIGTAFIVNAGSGNTVNVGVGKAWFNNSWIYNDSVLPLTAPSSDPNYNRIDAVVIEINATDLVRENTIKFVKGDASANPVRPTMIRSARVNQYALCYINRSKGSTSITGSAITNVVGSETPLINGPLEPINAEELLAQWASQLDEFVASETEEFDTWKNDRITELTRWFEQTNANLDAWFEQTNANLDAWFTKTKTELITERDLFDAWIANEQADFLAWYNEMKGQLGEDSAGNLQLQIDKEEVDRILLVGFVDGSKTFSEDGTVITSIASDGRKLTKTFTDEFKTLTSVLNSAAGAEIARMVKTYDSTGLLINTVVTYS